ncbi:MotA/TolQ/ExbB proton channel family protein [Synoicihabitans lomoniglobus]|uniref:MotA/TolQ/ExbB proton channel family protein n=1 Tax=Synoicihabitans lomoniglobus TaxID=2909285 RepID=A0AAE9ZYP1_9BACT|nr:MotA/TolQ/ExbB proton channel family protein [Opitutaceae bacterium LMO-M01]WED65669.1 MotA/TolQ/ExbB proton channel family protein [Opitutaceae bacterium LMO-M01]
MRNLIKSALVASVATIALWVVLRFTLSSEAWFHAFLFERSPVQWLSIAMFIFGADVLIAKARRLAAEQRHLTHAQWQTHDAAATADSVVRRRVSAMAELAQHHSPSFCQDTAKDLSEEDMRAVNESFVLPADVIGTLPLVGFFGTVWGLSKGLYNNFVLQGEDSTNSFANAIGTAFDTTLLALFLTIALTIAQSLLRRAEIALLERLDHFVEDHLLKLDATGTSPIPSSNDPRVWLDEFGIDPAELIGYLRGKLGSMATDLNVLSATNEKLTAALESFNATPPAAPDPGPQLEALATALRDSSAQAATAAREQLAKLDQLDTLTASSSAAATTLTAVLAQLEKARGDAATAESALQQAVTASGEQVAAQIGEASSSQLTTLDALKQLAAAQQSTIDALEQHAAAHGRALSDLQATGDAAHQRTQELVQRPKTFTVTAAPERADEPSA